MDYKISDHAELRWVHRCEQTEEAHKKIKQAWERGLPVKNLEKNCLECRYDPETEMVIVLAPGEVISTVVPYDWYSTEIEFGELVCCEECNLPSSKGLVCVRCGSTEKVKL